MRNYRLLAVLVLLPVVAWSQNSDIRDMHWGSDYNLHVTLRNDSSYVMDVRALHHENTKHGNPFLANSTTYFPVSLDRDFVSYLREHPVDTLTKPSNAADSIKNPAPYLTLWGALHQSIGGGYVHLINCIIYALEGEQLHLQHNNLRRPITDWKPDPPTTTYLRTKDWEYYAPTSQKAAQKEYKLRAKENDLGDLQGIPESFIQLFLKTSDKKYRKLVHAKDGHALAQIDLVRMMLGAKYLGEQQIHYISGCVRDAIARYTEKSLPSVIVFDDYQAAVAMTLDSAGYRVDYIVFQGQAQLSPAEVQERETNIRALVANINLANEELFRKRLLRYYN